MFEEYGWLVGVTGAVGIAGALLLVAPPPLRAVAAWLSWAGLEDSDETLTAVRGVLMRMSYVGTAVFLIVTVVGLAAQLKAASAAVALACAAVAAASVRVDGGRRRRAALGSTAVADARARRLLVGAGALTLVVVALACVLAVFHAMRTGPRSTLALESGTVLPAVEYYTLPLIAAASALLAAGAWLGVRRVSRRQSLAGVDTSVDRALRAVSVRRIAAGALGGQIVLLGTAVTGTPLLAQTAAPAVQGGTAWMSDPILVHTMALVALAVITAGLLVIAGSLLVPFWSARAQEARAALRKKA